MATPGSYATESVTSKDGTKIDYHRLGKGAGIVMLHGTMESGQSHTQLAEALSGAFTAYLPDRRVRSLGFPFVKDYNIQKEVEDLDALLAKTDSHNIFGVSSGGIACLQAALLLQTIRKAAVYEPPLSLSRSYAAATLKRFDGEMAGGKVAAALITAMKGAEMGPKSMKLMPRPMSECFTNGQIQKQDKESKEGDFSMHRAAVTLHYDLLLVDDMSEMLESFRAVSADVLLLGGSESSAYLRSSLDSLEMLPHVRRAEFPGLDHGGSSDLSPFNRRGEPPIGGKGTQAVLYALKCWKTVFCGQSEECVATSESSVGIHFHA